MSPYTAADGPPDLTATHAWAPASGAAPPNINDQGSTSPPMPWVRLLSITGWRALPESEDLREPRTYGDGEIVYPSRKLGKTIVYEMQIEARTIQSMQSHMTQLQRGFGDMNGEGTMTVTPYASYGGQVWTFTGRAISFDPEATWEYNPDRLAQLTWGAALSLRMSDPHFYADGVPYL